MATQISTCQEMMFLYSIQQAPVIVQSVNSAIHWINLYLMDNAIIFPNTYPLDSDFCSG